ncbi:serine/threonine-protein kinase [Perkinsela sp. CCAP 1560/4]|nr:serine/threonine-protein kinase [Perkinsela sp. CCAP 1560/4]|eukprot:KNH09349.1 serine/threonine-protein kinase [Perkinsela sp. CCAP 1560/4]
MLTKDDETLIECVYTSLREFHTWEKQVRYINGAGTPIPMLLFPAQAMAIFPFSSSSDVLLEDLTGFAKMLDAGSNDSVFHLDGRQDSGNICVKKAYIAIVDGDVNVFYLQISKPC